MSSAPVPVPVSHTPDPAEQNTLKKGGSGERGPVSAPVAKQNYKGFVAGVFSGIAKLSGESVPNLIGLKANLCPIEAD
jgi:hypothetical protein